MHAASVHLPLLCPLLCKEPRVAHTRAGAGRAAGAAVLKDMDPCSAPRDTNSPV